MSLKSLQNLKNLDLNLWANDLGENSNNLNTLQRVLNFYQIYNK